MNDTIKILFGLFGGLAIFIFGMNMMSECLQKVAGDKMKKILSMLTRNPVLGVLAGAVTTAVLQSSSATTVMAIGFVSAGLAAVLIAVSGAFPKLYATTDAIRDYGQGFIIITAAFFPVQGFLNALYFTLRSGGKTFVTFLFDSVYTWVAVLPLAVLLCTFTTLPVFAIYAIVQSADILKLIIGCILIKKGVWLSNLVS